MTHEQRLRALVLRRAEGTITPLEERELAGYVSLASNRETIERVLEEIWENQDAGLIGCERPAQMVKLITRRTTLRRWPAIAVAASLLCFVLASAIYFFTPGRFHREVSVAPSTPDRSAGPQALVLPDGSTVILKEGSRLVYPPTFNGLATRTVALEGEGYFDIQHDASRPFIVTTGQVQTHVLGTAFVIKAYNHDPQITVSVSRGKVRVTNAQQVIGTLVQDEQITFDKKRRVAAKHPLKSDSSFAWTRQEIFFDDITFAEAATELSERFQIKVRFAEERTSRCRFTATFVQGESFNKILEVICAFNHAEFHQTGADEVVIKGPGC